MRFNHRVKYDNRYYAAGEEVPIEVTEAPAKPVAKEVQPEKANTPHRGRPAKTV